MRRIQYFEAGDAVRGWGVLGVVIAHCATAALFAAALADPDPTRLQTLAATGDIGWEHLFNNRQIGAGIFSVQIVVYLFFGLSAYLLSRPYIAYALGTSKKAPPLGRYIRHRFGRVVPVFWFMIVVTIIQFGLNGTKAIDMIATFALGQYWTSAPFNVHLSQAWTLNVEAVFYIALPILACAGIWIYSRGGRWRGPLSLLPIALVCIPAWLLATTWLPDTTVPSQSPIGGLITFVPGVLIAVVEARWGDRIGKARWAAPLAILMVVVGLVFNYKQMSLAQSGSIAERNYLTIAAGLVLGGLILWQATERPTWRILRWRPIHWVGERSFSIYISHGAIIYEVRDFGEGRATAGGHFLQLAVLVVPLALLVGALLFKFVERPAFRYSRGERPLFREGPVVRIGAAAPTVGTTPDAAPGEEPVAAEPHGQPPVASDVAPSGGAR
ncbi:acyltransferase [Patulibacter sp. NPDC049589]|uniref:acyltransferase family protein n=1 Tax=Patulibacter sp. NPDC049589 TaxID=3154731 RepID=UPI0034265371